MQSPIRYASVVTKSGEKFIIRVTSQNERFLTGVEVDREGEEISGKDFDQRKRITELAAIENITEMRMNLTYARLERADP